jgi:hypothetical protein
MDTKRLLELAGMQLNETISSGQGGNIDKHVEGLAKEIMLDGIRMAKLVYAEEGPGKSGAKTEKEYIDYAVKHFLNDEYKKAIMDTLVEEYNDLVGN